MNRLLFLFLVMLSFTNLFPQQSTPIKDINQDLNKIVLMQPTGEFVNGQPEMIPITDSSDLYKSVMANIESSFVCDFMDLYFLAQSYLYNIGEVNVIEPAYLALTENHGGYAKTGFSLKTGEGNFNKENTSGH